METALETAMSLKWPTRSNDHFGNCIGTATAWHLGNCIGICILLQWHLDIIAVAMPWQEHPGNGKEVHEAKL